MESGGPAFVGEVCHTCGHTGFVDSITTCSLCRVISQHIYCMRAPLFEVPESWHCEDCLLNTGVVACSSSTVEEEAIRASCSASGKQNMQSNKTSFRIIDARKVKFITAEVVSTLESGLTSSQKGISQIFSHRGDLRNVKPPPKCRKTIKSAPADSKEVEVPSRPMKGPVNVLLDISPSKHLQSKRINEEKEQGGSPKLQDNCLVVEELPKVALAAKEPRDLDKRKDGNDLPVNNSVPYYLLNVVTNTASCSIPQFNNISSKEMSLSCKLVISSDAKFHHVLEPCWRGAFELLGMVMVVHGGVHGYLSCQVSPKVYDISKKMPGTLKFKALPRESVWPKIFKLDPPSRNDVALQFFCEEERHKEKYGHFVQRIHSCDYALQGSVADVELLLFSSAQLRSDSSDSENYGGQIYFWGVFRHVRRKRAALRLEKAISYCCPSPRHDNHDKLQVPPDDSAMVVDMEVDMFGGSHVGTVDISVPKLDTPPGFSKPLQKSPVSFTLKQNKSTPLDRPPGFPLPLYKENRKQHAGTNSSLASPVKNSENTRKQFPTSPAANTQIQEAACRIHK